MKNALARSKMADSMVPNTEKMPEEQTTVLAQLAKVMGFIFPDELKCSKPTFLRIWAQVNCNRFGVFDVASSTSRGTAMYSPVNLLNHSCHPNCSPVFGSTESSLRRISVQLLSDVGAGEELNISYMDDLLLNTKATHLHLVPELLSVTLILTL